MATSSHSLCLLVLLLAVGVAMSTAAVAEPPLPQLGQEPQLPLPGVVSPKIAVDCLKSVMHAESCASDILQSVKSHNVHLSTACCNALQNIGGQCIDEVFSMSPFTPAIIRTVCRLVAAIVH